MSAQTTAVISRAIHAVAGGGVHFLTDRELLRRFAETGDQAAFATLFRRHSAMVHGVCRRSLPTVQDAEDACQAVFLLLARKAKSNHWHNSAANWLYSTARRVAWNARRAARRRAQREAKTASSATAQPVDQMSGREMLGVLDEELQRLPSIYREVLVLCCLEGLARDEAAARLAVPLATLKTRLERGRKRLGEALTKRGVELGAGLLALAAVTPTSTGSPMLAEEVLKVVRGKVSPAVVALLKGMAARGALAHTKVTLLMLIGATALALSLAAAPPIGTQSQGQDGVAAKESVAQPAAKAEATKQSAAEERILAGKVLDAAGKPVVADLFLLSPDLIAEPGRLLAIGKSNADGTFRVTAPALNLDTLIAKAEGHGLGCVLLKTTDTGEVVLKLPKEQPFDGQIIDMQGRPIAGVEVGLRNFVAPGTNSIDSFLNELQNVDQTGSAPSAEDIGTATGFVSATDRFLVVKTDAQGRFRFRGLAAEQFAGLHIHGAGVAGTNVSLLNRQGFDPKPFNDKMLKSRPANGFGPSQVTSPVLHAPNFRLAVEPEKVVRGSLREARSGKPAVGVAVVLEQDDGLSRQSLRTTTDAAGRIEIHGAKKWATYRVETNADPRSGWLPTLTTAPDTPGYEPINLDVKCHKGVIVKGVIRDKGTRRPIAGVVSTGVFADNKFAKEYIGNDGYLSLGEFQAGPDGRYRAIVVPGLSLLMGGTKKGVDIEYKMPTPDPQYPNLFATYNLMFGYRGLGGSYGFVVGNWCRVLDTAPTDEVLVQDIELERAATQSVKIVDASGQPVKGTRSSGYFRPGHFVTLPEKEPQGEILTVYDVAPDEERLIVVGYPKLRLVGALHLKSGDKDAKVQLGAGGEVTGRVTDQDGKPLAGVGVSLLYDGWDASLLYQSLHWDKPAVTDADGRFGFDAIIPEQKFRLVLPADTAADIETKPRRVIELHGMKLDVGDLKMTSNEKE